MKNLEKEISNQNMRKKKIKKIKNKNKNKKPEKLVSKRFVKQSNFKSTEEKVLIVPYISNIDDRNPRLYYDITLT